MNEEKPKAFKKLNAIAVCKTSQGYKELDIYNRNGLLYVKNGVYFNALLSNNLTSNSKLTWDEIIGTSYEIKQCKVHAA